MKKKTQPAAIEPETTQPAAIGDPVTAKGAGLHESEWAELDELARTLGKKPHWVRTYALRYFLNAYRSGKIKPTVKQQQTLPDL